MSAFTEPMLRTLRESTTDSVVELLARCDTYPERPARVERIETHISSVFLTDRFVYKMKKPVKFDFLDFSTIERRRWACLEEVRINRRLAPHVYLGVVPVTRTASGSLRLGGDGLAVDWVVKMRRLPADQALDRLIHSGAVRPAHIEALQQRLLDFYLREPPLGVRTETYRQEIEQHLLANRAELLRPEHGLNAAQVKRVHAAQLRVLRVFPELLDARVVDGRIVEGHGDLRPEHIYFAPEPVLIDGIEFNAEMRRLDVLDELSFLAMECAALGAGEIGDKIVAAYCAAANDHPPAALLRFYETYRACVRAKVAAIRARQLTGDERATSLATAADYLSLAARFSAELGPPLLLMVWGLSGTGKSVLATALAEALGCELLQTDAVRRELFGASEEPLDFNAERYTAINRERVYEELFHRADALLAADVSVVIDGTFLTTDQRARAAKFLGRDNVDLLSIQCVCPDNVALERIRQRLAAGNSLSEFRPDLFAQQRKLLERDCIRLPTCIIDTTTSLPEMTQRVFAELHATFPHDIAVP